MEWIVAVGAFLLVCGVVIGVPLYLLITRWSSRADRRAAEARRRAAAAYPTSPADVLPTSRSGGRRRVLNP